MKLNRFEDTNKFYDRVTEYLLQHESHHCLLLRIVSTLIRNPKAYNSQPYSVTVEAEGDIVAVAIRIPPSNLMVSKIGDLKALDIIAGDLYKNGETIPGVRGLKVETESFARQWQTLTGQSYELSMQFRTYQLDEVQPITKIPGYLRPANESDCPLLINWLEAFQIETAGATQQNIELAVERYLGRKSLYFWQDEIPVSVVGGTKVSPNAALIGPVYTAPEYRRKGYASASVTAVSQILLDRGCRYCFLFTDLANPTSNHIYQAIGYQPVCDWDEYRFKTNSQPL